MREKGDFSNGEMIKVYLTAVFIGAEPTKIETVHGMSGMLTPEQYQQAVECFLKMAEWTNENSVKFNSKAEEEY